MVLLTRRRRGIGALLAAVLVASLTTTSIAAASPPAVSKSAAVAASGGAGTGGSSAAVLQAAGGAQQVTLVTGDTVQVQRLGNGSYNAVPPTTPRRVGQVPVTFSQLSAPNGDHYVFPSDALALVAGGALDRELFNVRRLVQEGDSDAQSKQLPVIVQLGKDTPNTTPALARAADALPATARVRGLKSIHAAAVGLTKKDLGRFWTRARGPSVGGRSLGGGLKHLWLDRKVHATLDQSVPQIGAPEAWKAGLDGSGTTIAILDTGIDPTHPDFAGRIAGTANFSSDASYVDGHGHGTHVASILAGSGAASAGRYRGVAPGARLLIGKVLDNSGSGPFSSVIAGMEWASGSGVPVVSMSLGGGPSDGTDPLSLAVDQLTAANGTLFVIAAGNQGADPETINTPGSAASALTVGAVDKSDQLAGFSSRGPLTRTGALKPDITAPGVAIVAARAAGTSLGEVVDDFYTKLSGTSMATPHVAGAAAVLAQQHPDWHAAQLKAALMQSAHPDPTLSPYQQGSGRVDVARAIHQSVLATPASLDFGGLPFPQQAPVTKTVTLTNTGDTAVTLNLAGELRDPSGTPLGDTLTIDPATITLPAHGSADVRATFDATNQPFGGYVGWLHATDPASNTELLHLAVAAKVQPPSHNLRLRPIPPAGWEGDNCACDNRHVWIIVRVDAPARPIIVDRVLPFVDVHVDDGVYLATTNFQHFNPQTGDLTFAQLLDPEVVVSGADRELVLDGNDAKLVAAEAPQPTEQTSAEQAFVRGTTFGGAWLIRWAEIYWSFLGKAALRVTPTKPVTIGSFRVATGFELIPDQARMRVNQPGRAELHASYANYHFQQPKLAFDGTVDLVDAGDGSAEAIAAAHVRGRLALLSGPTVVGPVPVNCTLGCGFPDGLARLRDAGALAAVAYLPEQGEGRPGWCGPYVFSADREDKCPQTMPLPVLTLGRGEGLGLHELASHEPVPIELHTQAGPISSTYRLRFDDTGAITSQPYHVHQGQLAILNNRYHGPTPTDLQRRTGILDAESVGVLTDVWLSGTREITEYVGPATPNLLWSTLLLANAVSARQDPDFFLRTGSNDELTTAELYPVADARTVDWFTPTTVTGFRVPPEILAGPLANSVPWTDSCRFCREARGLGAVPVLSSDDGTHFGAGLLFAALGFLPAIQYDAHLYREGQEVPSFNPFGPVLFDLREYPGPAQYRLAIHVRTSDPTIPIPPDISTTWYFTSQEPTSNKGIYNFNSPCDAQSPPDDRCRVERLLLLSYDYGSTLSIDNTSPAPGAAQIRVHVFQQAGAPASHILGLHEQVSFDHGAHWQPAEATVAGDGNYDVKFTYPTTARTGDTVSLRTQAWDDAGNRVQQTTLDVYQLTTR